ncbi:MAG TPA: TonB family protein [Nannocystis exedens]|nr:TonB family protein [Nannocystis exedens]
MSNTVQNGNSGVKVNTGTPGGVPGGTGKPDSKGTGSKGGGPPKGEPGGTGETWKPRSELAIKTLPKPLKIPVIQCPAVEDLGVEGTVILAVQVRADGKVRRVKVTKGMGYGCDKVAQKALRKAKFRPAIGTDGKPADYELRYEYEFQLDD